MLPSFTILLPKSNIHWIPISPVACIISATIPDNPGALCLFIFCSTALTSATLMQSAGPSLTPATSAAIDQYLLPMPARQTCSCWCGSHAGTDRWIDKQTDRQHTISQTMHRILWRQYRKPIYLRRYSFHTYLIMAENSHVGTLTSKSSSCCSRINCWAARRSLRRCWIFSTSFTQFDLRTRLDANKPTQKVPTSAWNKHPGTYLNTHYPGTLQILRYL